MLAASVGRRASCKKLDPACGTRIRRELDEIQAGDPPPIQIEPPANAKLYPVLVRTAGVLAASNRNIRLHNASDPSPLPAAGTLASRS
ncbi:MAG: hypothetical protein M0Z91_05145 [Actinomycetota bacterium]|nr:hypothetical protein [Actinomycetota bacterium]